ncbi:MAG: hypothetical protein JWO08_1181 [Verrucomicrobiaceae bacterium]|nr:hypothetical protein [Verrucomicrobiaceae bacterium]
MNQDERLLIFPNASPACLASNAGGTRPDAKLERHPEHAALHSPPAEKGRPERFHIRFVSVRKRLIDPDNLSEKWLLDCLRFAQVIPGDEPEKITLETTQRKARKGEEEHTLIEVFLIPT